MKTLYTSDDNFREKLNLHGLKINFIVTLLCFLFANTVSANEDAGPATISVTVNDKQTNEAIPFANVVVYQNNVQVAVSSTDIDGRCIVRVPGAGKYNFKAIYIGYASLMVNNMEVFHDRPNRLNIFLKSSEVSLTSCCMCYCFYEPSENWWPKLWTPYRAMYAAYKEKREAKKAKGLVIKEGKKPTVTYDEPIVLRDPLPEEQMANTIRTKDDLVVYPNPSSDIFHINSTRVVGRYVFTTSEGKLIQEIPYNETGVTIDVATIPPGIYYVMASTPDKMYSKKVVVTK